MQNFCVKVTSTDLGYQMPCLNQNIDLDIKCVKCNWFGLVLVELYFMNNHVHDNTISNGGAPL